MLKDAATIITKPLAYIINLSLHSGSVPMEWKAAKIIPLFKSGSMVELDNYRPISILPVLSKILERIVYINSCCHSSRIMVCCHLSSSDSDLNALLN